VSENKPGGSDPFEGLDWDAELENWDESTSKPGGAEVPESFSAPPPAVTPAAANPPSERIPTPNSLRSSRPLYRPPPTLGKSGATPPAMPPPKKKPSSDRPLPSLVEDADESTTDTKNNISSHPPDRDDEDENRTVIAPVSQDLLAQLEAAGVRRAAPAPKKQADPTPPAKPVAIDVGGMDEVPEERTEEHAELPPQEDADPSVVTSAPEYLRQRAIARAPSTAELKAAGAPPPDAPVRDGKFDPFHGMDVEPPVSENFSPRKLLEPEERKHSAEEPTAVVDKKALFGALKTKQPVDKQDADSTVKTAPVMAEDLFATRDPFSQEAQGDADISATEEDAEAAGLIDLLHGEDASSDALPAIETDTRPASDWVAHDVEMWRARVERVANDARTLEKNKRARALVVASELSAIAGDIDRAIELAEEAWNESPNEPLAIRQLRQLLASQGRWEEVTPLLENEIKSGSNPLIKSHAAMLAADAARVARSSPDEAMKLYESAQRTSANDIRPAVARATMAISASKPLPLLRWPQNIGVEPLSEAVVRRARGGEAAEDIELSEVLDGIASYAETGKISNDLGEALDVLSTSESLGTAAKWIRIALDAASNKTRRAAFDRLGSVGDGRAAQEARLLLGLDLGEIAPARDAAATLARDHASLNTVVTHHAVTALAGQTPRGDELVPFADSAAVRSIGRGLAIAANEDVNSAFAAADPLDASVRVARRLAVGGHVEPSLREKTSRGAQFGFALADAMGGGGSTMTVDALTPLITWEGAQVDEALLRMLASLSESDVEAAIAAARQAANVDPTAFPATLAALGFLTEDSEPIALANAEGSTAELRGASIALRIALNAIRRSDLDSAKRAVDIAMQNAPDDPVAPFLAELRARRAGDFEAVIEAIRARMTTAGDPIGKASNLVREVFLLLGSDLATCIERAHDAWKELPRDLTVRALYERIAGEGAEGRADFRAEMARTLDGPARAEMLLDAAREAERKGDLDAAEKLASEAEAAGSGAEAVALRHRVQSRGNGAARLAEELLEAAKKTDEPAAQRELYEGLADLDLFSRGDTASAIMWHQAILEGSPDHLPSLRRLEHMLTSVGREDDYEPIASQIARVLPPDTREAHVEVAARLRLRRAGAEWISVADLIDLAAERENPSLWTTRMMDALARMRNDDKGALRACDLLLARSDRPLEVAALATRAAEAAFRLGDVERARGYLDRALDADPQHPTALASVAELRRAARDFRGAAEAIEQMAQNQQVSEHRLEDWHSAAVLWLDKVDDTVRGRAALERAAEIDLGYGDIFDRLIALAKADNDFPIIHDLYQRRLAQLEDPTLKAQIHVEHARLLLANGDRDGARTSLTNALDAQPTNSEALEEGLRLAEEAEDWPEYEQYLIKFSKAQTDDAAQIGILKRLGALYEGPLPNPSRAEAVYKKILSHEEGNDEILARLVDVYVQLGDPDMAVETHQERVRLAADPTARRARLLELARILDEHANDPDRALKALEQARSSDPSDLEALAALAEFHTKHGRPDALSAALDQAIGELRNRLASEPDLRSLQSLAKILELRGREEGVKVVRAAIAGLSGEVPELVGAEDAAAVAELDALLCPPELIPELRAFLDKAGEALEKSVPVDLRALKAAKLGTTNPPLKAKIDAVARGFGLPDPDVVISRAMPLLCLPVGAKPFQIVIGDGIVGTDDDVARRFALARTMKLCGARCASLIRVPAADLKVYLDALLHHLHPEHPAPEIDAERLDEITKRLQRFIPRKDEAELKTLAGQIVAEGAVNVERLAGAASTWGDRVALLAVGDVGAALRGVAWSLGQKEVPKDPEELRKWLMENSAARELLMFAISDTYIEARQRAGVA
jgi:tetratricopeptide (TPR) repeat protein